MSDLNIPQSALDEHMRFVRPHALIDGDVDWQSVERQVRATSNPVVAAELRRFAALFPPPTLADPGAFDRGFIHACGEFCRALNRRADELDGGELS